MGNTLNNYIRMRKMNYAMQLLQNSNLSFTEAAQRLGFSDQSAFNRAFKKEFNMTPRQMLQQEEVFELQPVPEVVHRPIKNLNGDVITDFTLIDFVPKTIKGVVFQVDIAKPDFKELIRSKADALLEGLEIDDETRGYMVYSNCEPNSTKFNAMFGVELEFDSDLDHVFTIQLPDIFCAKFNYTGDLLEISDIFTTDFSRFLRISRLEMEEHDVELIQSFPSVRDFDQAFEVYVPIKKLPIDDLA